MNGVVKFFDQKKGYGFIKPDDGGKDIFVHYTGVKTINSDGKRNLSNDDKVSFEIEEGIKGPQAENVYVL